MQKHRLLHKENDNLKDENAHLAHLVRSAEERVKELTNLLQKNRYNVMPALTVCNDLVETPIKTRIKNQSARFASAGFVSLKSTALCLADGPFVAAGQLNGEISLWAIRQGDGGLYRSGSDNRLSSGSLYRFSSAEKNTNDTRDREEPNALSKASDSLIGHHGPVSSLNWIGESLSSASLDGTLKLWDIQTSHYQSVYFGMPAASHCPIEGGFIAATCTKKMFMVDPREGSSKSFELDDAISAVASTDMGTMLGTTTGKLLLFDIRTAKTYQTLQVSPAGLPIGRICGRKNVTVTSFDGIVRLLGKELPLYVERDFSQAPSNGLAVGSCYLPLTHRDFFVISGSNKGKAFVFSSSGNVQSLTHAGLLVTDCVPLGQFVGSLVTCDNQKGLTMWACTFNQSKT